MSRGAPPARVLARAAHVCSGGDDVTCGAPRCTGQPPSSPGPRRHCPQVRTSHQLSLAAGGGNAHLATHHQNLKAASNSTLPWPDPHPSVRGRTDGWRGRGAALVLELAHVRH